MCEEEMIDYRLIEVTNSNVSSTNITNHRQWPPLDRGNMGAGQITTVVGYLVVIVLTVGGNLLVVAAFARETTLRAITNYWIVSLAITDVVLALTVMPLQVNYYRLSL